MVTGATDGIGKGYAFDVSRIHDAECYFRWNLVERDFHELDWKNAVLQHYAHNQKIRILIRSKCNLKN